VEATVGRGEQRPAELRSDSPVGAAPPQRRNAATPLPQRRRRAARFLHIADNEHAKMLPLHVILITFTQ